MATKKELEAELAREKRAYGACFEWFCAETRGEMPLCVDVDGTAGIRVLVHGLTRHCGGVAVVSVPSDSYREMPEYLDDLLPRWEADRCPNIRHAARFIRLARDAAIAYAATAHLNDFARSEVV